jgi:hypothetical protein
MQILLKIIWRFLLSGSKTESERLPVNRNLLYRSPDAGWKGTSGRNITFSGSEFAKAFDVKFSDKQNNLIMYGLPAGA